MSYTRNGEMMINAQGQLVTASGLPIQPVVTIPAEATSVTIGTDGTVSVTQPGSAISNQIGNLQIVDFINPAGLQASGQNLFVETAASGAPQAGTPGLNGLGTL